MSNLENAESSSIKEIAIYLLLLVTISWSFNLFPSFWLEKITAQVSSAALRVLGFTSSWWLLEKTAYISLLGNRVVTVAIIRECTGIHVFAIFAGLVLPLKGRVWLRKAASLFTSALLLFLMNLSRVMLTILLTAYDIPPFAWIFAHPTVETYHYPLSFLYGLLGVALLVLMISRWILPQLGNMLIVVSFTVKDWFGNLINDALNKNK